MANVSIHAPKTPVTEKSNGIAIATIPNICKMPGVPYTPTPLPNIGRSSDSPTGYSTTVLVNGARVAVEGCSFGSQGDIASKATGGGILSANTCGPTRFIGPGTPDVRIEGRGVHLLGDPTFNNCAPGGGAPNAATMAGIVQDALKAKAQRLGVEKELQEICDVLCECEAEGTRNENCLYHKMDKKERAEKGTGTIRNQVPYDMEPEDEGPPKPYMSKTPGEGYRATRKWAIKDSRRPDATIVRNPALEPRGNNIRAVIEVKVGDTGWGRGQEKAYKRIGGGRKRLLVLDDETCQCSPPPAPPPAIPAKRDEDVDAKKTAQKATAVRKKRPEPVVALSPLAVLVSAAAAIGAAIAIVATAPVAATAAAAVALIAVSSGSSQPAGGDDAI